jgi:hypothetical protein
VIKLLPSLFYFPKMLHMARMNLHTDCMSYFLVANGCSIISIRCQLLWHVCDPFLRAPHRRWVLGDGMRKKDTEIPPKRAFV